MRLLSWQCRGVCSSVYAVQALSDEVPDQHVCPGQHVIKVQACLDRSEHRQHGPAIGSPRLGQQHPLTPEDPENTDPLGEELAKLDPEDRNAKESELEERLQRVLDSLQNVVFDCPATVSLDTRADGVAVGKWGDWRSCTSLCRGSALK
eukprot:1138520-Pelagomonas_calceolata.AAC.3